jgi:hypoxanthine phosphoribosyltransferase
MERHLHSDLARILVDKQTINEHVAQLARRIEADYADAERVYLIGVLKGAFIFLADLARELRIPHVVDFIAVSSYGKSAQSGQVRFIMDTREPVDGEHVIIVEDIVDTGNTLRYLVENFHGRNPASLRTCALVRKETTPASVTIPTTSALKSPTSGSSATALTTRIPIARCRLSRN